MERAGFPLWSWWPRGLAHQLGTQAMTSVGALAVYDAIGLMKAADIAAAMSFEANQGCGGRPGPPGPCGSPPMMGR